MRFLADESCDFAVVRALRANGHDVIAVAEVAARTEDAGVVEWALRPAQGHHQAELLQLCRSPENLIEQCVRRTVRRLG
jgi:hypothetical protein